MKLSSALNINQKGIAPILVLLFLLSALGIGAFLVQQRTGFIPDFFSSKNAKTELIQNTGSNEEYEPLQNESELDPEPPGDWKLIFKTPTGDEETLYSFQNSEKPKLIRWGDYLFFNSIDGQGAHVKRHDLKSLATTTIHTKSPNNNTPEIQDIKLINDDLYFTDGGYFVEGNTYYLDSPESKPKKISQSGKGEIKSMSGKYWIIGGDGDSCYGLTEYQVLDIDSKKITFRFPSNDGCDKGEQYLGIDHKGRFLITYHTDTYHGAPKAQNFTYLSYIPLTETNRKISLLSEEKMPKDIVAIRYLEENQKLILFGKDIYVFDLTEDSLTKVISLPSKWQVYFGLYVTHVAEGSACLGNEFDSVKLLADWKNNQLLENDQSCSIKEKVDEYLVERSQENQRFVKEFSLPEGYKFEYVKFIELSEPNLNNP